MVARAWKIQVLLFETLWICFQIFSVWSWLKLQILHGGVQWAGHSKHTILFHTSFVYLLVCPSVGILSSLQSFIW